jgi:hypothetical protein
MKSSLYPTLALAALVAAGGVAMAQSSPTNAEVHPAKGSFRRSAP